MKLSDLFYVDTLEGRPTELWPLTHIASRRLVWRYRKPDGAAVIKYSENPIDLEILQQTTGNRIDLDYYPMTDQQIDQNTRELFRYALSEEPDVRLVRTEELAPFFKESLRGLAYVGVDESQKDLDLGVPTIVLPKFTVSPDRVVGIGVKHLGVVSKSHEGVGMFMTLGKIRSAYLRQ